MREQCFSCILEPRLGSVWIPRPARWSQKETTTSMSCAVQYPKSMMPNRMGDNMSGPPTSHVSTWAWGASSYDLRSRFPWETGNSPFHCTFQLIHQINSITRNVRASFAVLFFFVFHSRRLQHGIDFARYHPICGVKARSLETKNLRRTQWEKRGFPSKWRLHISAEPSGSSSNFAKNTECWLRSPEVVDWPIWP
jgi:hypothetical protein